MGPAILFVLSSWPSDTAGLALLSSYPLTSTKTVASLVLSAVRWYQFTKLLARERDRSIEANGVGRYLAPRVYPLERQSTLYHRELTHGSALSTVEPGDGISKSDEHLTQSNAVTTAFAMLFQFCSQTIRMTSRPAMPMPYEVSAIGQGCTMHD